MARLQQRATSTRAHRSASKLLRQKKQKKKPYKIVLEVFTKEKNKLRTMTWYDPRPPRGYTFIPVGAAPEVTERCTELCRREKYSVLEVSTRPKNLIYEDPAKVSHHVHRIGHHFPADVVDKACAWFGYDFDGRRFKKNSDLVPSSRLAEVLDNHSNENAKERVLKAIKDLFPRMPDRDRQAIVAHAFQEVSYPPNRFSSALMLFRGRIGWVMQLNSRLLDVCNSCARPHQTWVHRLRQTLEASPLL